jgi:hypothetical protein
MGYDYKKISTNWNKFLAEGLKEEYSFQDDVASMAVRGGEQLRRGEKPNAIRASSQNAAAPEGAAKKLERLLPKVMTNPITKSVLTQTIAAIKDQKVDLKSVLKLYEVVASAIKHGRSPDDALKTKGIFDKIFGDNVEISFGMEKAFQRPRTAGEKVAMKRSGAAEKGPADIALANLKFRFEEWLNAGESVNLLTEEDNPIVSRKLTFDNPRKPTIAIMTITLKGGEEYVAKTRIRNGNVGSAKSRAMRAAEKKMLAAVPSR